MASSTTRARIRRYGELMRTEGRRLTEMVEQILEFAGIQSGQRGFALRPVGVAPLAARHPLGLLRRSSRAPDWTSTFDIPTICRRFSATSRRCAASFRI